MAQIHDYKRFENNIVKKLSALCLLVCGRLWLFIKEMAAASKRKYTLVLVPHSEKQVYNLRVSFLQLVFAAVVLVSVLATLVWTFSSYSGSRAEISVKNSRLKDTQASLDQLRDELSDFLREARGFESALSGVFSSLGLRTEAKPMGQGFSGDLSSFFDTQESAHGRLRETDELENLASYMAAAQGPLAEIESLLEGKIMLLTEIPNIWPIKGGMGHISQPFGENPNPFTGENYIHRGIDLSTYRQGDPILAAADGQIVGLNYDAGGFGNYVIIRHKHGFYTRYGHLLSFRVRIGDHVEQGDIIGYIGNTGRSTGPHLHYEVHIGSDIVDPYKFLNIRKGTVKLGG